MATSSPGTPYSKRCPIGRGRAILTSLRGRRRCRAWIGRRRPIPEASGFRPTPERIGGVPMLEGATRRRKEGGLQRCLVEGDAAATACSRRRRCQALLVSLAAQVSLLAGLVLVPLVATSERVFALRMTPLPMPVGSLRGKPLANTNSSGPHHINIIRPIPYDRFNRPLFVPHRPQTSGADSEGARNPGVEDGSAWGIPNGVLRPGTDGATQWIFQPPGPARPPAETQKNRVVRNEGVQQAFLTQRVQPTYPPLAVQMRQEGTVQLHAIIGRDGAVTALEVLSGHSILAQAALEAVRQWRYRPTLLNGKPVEVETYITVIFQLRR